MRAVARVRNVARLEVSIGCDVGRSRVSPREVGNDEYEVSRCGDQRMVAPGGTIARSSGRLSGRSPQFGGTHRCGCGRHLESVTEPRRWAERFVCVLKSTAASSTPDRVLVLIRRRRLRQPEPLWNVTGVGSVTPLKWWWRADTLSPSSLARLRRLILAMSSRRMSPAGVRCSTQRPDGGSSARRRSDQRARWLSRLG